MRARFLLVAGLVGVAIAVAVTLAPSEPRRSGTNDVPPSGPVARLAPGAQACQPEDVPGETRAVGLHVDARGGNPRPSVRVAGPGGGDAVVGRSVHPLADGVVRVELGREADPDASEVCVRNDGARPLRLIGFPTGARDGGRSGPITLDYYRSGRESWWQLAPAIADRMSLGKSELLGDWTLWLAVAMALAAWVLAAVALWRIGAAE